MNEQKVLKQKELIRQKESELIKQHYLDHPDHCTFKQFTAELEVVPFGTEGKYSLTKGFSYYVGEVCSNKWVVVDKGFVSDGASVPKSLQWIIPPWGEHGQAAVLHDHLCVGGVVYKEGVPYQPSFKEQDDIFLEAMKVSGVGWVKRYTMYSAVRCYTILKRSCK